MEINKLKEKQLKQLNIYFEKLDLDHLEGEDFADSVNRLFPLDTSAAVESSLEALEKEGTNLVKIYTKPELVFIVDKIISKASEFGIEVEIPEKEEGGNKVELNWNEIFASKEFKDAVEAEVTKRTETSADKKKVQDLDNQVKAFESQVTELKKNIATLTNERDNITKEFNTHKDNIEKAKVANTRYDKLVKAGFKFEKTKESVIATLINLSDEEFTNYENILLEAKGSAPNPKLSDETKGSVVPNPLTEEEKEKKNKKFGVLSEILTSSDKKPLLSRTSKREEKE